jgi:polyhydroxyalkanoate synthase subunit PhaC
MPKTVPPTPLPAFGYQIKDPEEFTRNLLRVVEAGTRAMTDIMDRADAKPSPFSPASEAGNAKDTLAAIAQAWSQDPAKLAEAQTKLFKAYADVWAHSVQKMLGHEVNPVVEPGPGDNRFKDPEWSTNPYFDYWKQAYLVTTNWAEEMLAKTPGLDERAQQKANFYMRLVSSAASPSNIPALNPEIMRETFASNAANLVRGMTHLCEDMEKSGDLLQISQTDTESFVVGQNLALTPGKVVFQNDLLQLIQYTPTTKSVHETPIFFVPPWINKFYILDLTPPKSLIKYVVDQGFTVFVVSWVNPDATLADRTFEDYMLDGILEAAKAVCTETGVKQCNVLGYCVGGTLVATTLAYLAARGGDNPFKSVTFLTTQVDFEKAGDLLVFIDDEQLVDLESIMADRGYLDGSRMANVFNMMRPRDLIWPYVVNNYMLGKKPLPFDLLYWNQDSTRMTAANHNFYLREFYHENRLARGDMVFAGEKLDLTAITLPVYELAARDDHIAPAVSVFKGSKMFSGPVEFVLAGSGHIAGVINPPDKMKYQHWTGPKPVAGQSMDEWAAAAEEHLGSWWGHWTTWLATQSGKMVDARTPGTKLKVIEDAPGSYVRVRHTAVPHTVPKPAAAKSASAKPASRGKTDPQSPVPQSPGPQAAVEEAQHTTKTPVSKVAHAPVPKAPPSPVPKPKVTAKVKGGAALAKPRSGKKTAAE